MVNIMMIWKLDGQYHDDLETRWSISKLCFNKGFYNTFIIIRLVSTLIKLDTGGIVRLFTYS